MKNFRKFVSVAVLAASLAPFTAQARSGDLGTTGQPQHLVNIASAPAHAQHGRIAENAKVSAGYALANGAAEYAASDSDDGFAG